MTRPVDEHLFGGWRPDPGQPDAARIASLQISPAGWLRYVVREGGVVHGIEHEYRVETLGRLGILGTDGAWTEQPYVIEYGPVLVIGTRRYVSAVDPADRPWPADVDGARDGGGGGEPAGPSG